MSAKRRQGAEYLAWSAVHGLAVLLIEGTLRSIAAREVADIGGQLLDMVDQGLSRRAD